MNEKDLLHSVEYAVLTPSFTNEDIRKAVDFAAERKIKTITVSSQRTKFTSILAEGRDMNVNTVISFPTGMAAIPVKRCEAEWAVTHGADSLAFALNLGAFLECSPDFVMKEVTEILAAADGRPVTSIIETALLSSNQIVKIAGIAAREGSEWIQLSTGTNETCLDAELIAAVRDEVPSGVGIKAAVPQLTQKIGDGLLAAGVTQIVTSGFDEVF